MMMMMMMMMISATVVRVSSGHSLAATLNLANHTSQPGRSEDASDQTEVATLVFGYLVYT